MTTTVEREPVILQFWHTGDFEAVRAAEKYLSDRGFSLGRTQRGSPRGILLGDYDIQKWRNLRPREREMLHGHMTGGREGPVLITIFASAPPEVRARATGAAP